MLGLWLASPWVVAGLSGCGDAGGGAATPTVSPAEKAKGPSAAPMPGGSAQAPGGGGGSAPAPGASAQAPPGGNRQASGPDDGDEESGAFGSDSGIGLGGGFGGGLTGLPPGGMGAPMQPGLGGGPAPGFGGAAGQPQAPATPPPPPPPPSYRDMARVAFYQGHFKLADQLMAAHLLQADDVQEVVDAYRWATVRRRPQMSVRVGVGLDLKSPPDTKDYNPISRKGSGTRGAGGMGDDFGGGLSLGGLPGLTGPGMGGPAAGAGGGPSERLKSVAGWVAEEFLEQYQQRFEAGAFGTLYHQLDPQQIAQLMAAPAGRGGAAGFGGGFGGDVGLGGGLMGGPGMMAGGPGMMAGGPGGGGLVGAPGGLAPTAPAGGGNWPGDLTQLGGGGAGGAGMSVAPPGGGAAGMGAGGMSIAPPGGVAAAPPGGGGSRPRTLIDLAPDSEDGGDQGQPAGWPGGGGAAFGGGVPGGAARGGPAMGQPAAAGPQPIAIAANSQLVAPGLVFVGEGSVKELLEKAEQQELDLIYIFQVEISTVRRSRQARNDTRVRLLRVGDGSSVAASKRLDSLAVNRSIDRGDDKEVPAAIQALFRVFDESPLLEPLPEAVTAKVLTERRLPALVAETDRSALERLAEIKFYRLQDLLTAEDVERAFAEILDQQRAKVLLAVGSGAGGGGGQRPWWLPSFLGSGDGETPAADPRREILDKLLPPMP
jgi:hypothetical protein